MAKIIKFPGKYVNEMVGKRVIGIDGPGQSETSPGNYGTIIAETTEIWGDFWVVQWDNGHQEPYYKRSIKHISEIYGIGVYYQ
ncbi:hypothetical protein MOF21_08375 [Bacillus haynesii]|uniref:hypothetical protein n=1 Tax=Bacillus haynesii TaxID=1925021 RepID=UPI00227E01DA|nr:hypothetical protein [Bacillus haynesii]MCY9329950.1 hypothetical protein [Bacillus haynesii]